MTKNFTNFVPLIVFLALVIAFAALLLRPEKAEMISKPLPALSLEGLKAEDLKGPAVVNFFASWCTPCRAEHSLLIELAENDVPIYGIAYKDKKADMKRYLEDLGNPYTKIGADIKGRAFIDWGLTGVPESFVIDGEGRIRYHHGGVLLPEDIKHTILPLIKELSK